MTDNNIYKTYIFSMESVLSRVLPNDWLYEVTLVPLDDVTQSLEDTQLKIVITFPNDYKVELTSNFPARNGSSHGIVNNSLNTVSNNTGKAFNSLMVQIDKFVSMNNNGVCASDLIDPNPIMRNVAKIIKELNK